MSKTPVSGVPGAAPAWAGECWAIEAELTRKTVRRTTAIMAEILTRTGDYGCPAAEVAIPGVPPRHARVLYLCSAAARPTVRRARDALPPALAGRVEIRGLPAAAALADATPAGPALAARPAASPPPASPSRPPARPPPPAARPAASPPPAALPGRSSRRPPPAGAPRSATVPDGSHPAGSGRASPPRDSETPA